jgi:hypothetical protein
MEIRNVIQWLGTHIVRIELVLYILLLITLYAKQQTPAVDGVLTILLFTLAGLYFLCAYAPPAAETKSIFGLMAAKVHYISSSITVIAVAFTVMHFAGAQEMFMIGGMSSVAAALILIVTWFSGRSRMLIPMIIRSVFFAVIAYTHFTSLGGM